MSYRLDHIVIWVDDVVRSLEFFEKVVGLKTERAEQFLAGEAPFPSVRVSEDTIIDLMPRMAAQVVNAMAGNIDRKTAGSAGHPVNHICISMSRSEFDELRARLHENGVVTGGELQESFGGRGLAPHTFYFPDPDGNVFEARYYEG